MERLGFVRIRQRGSHVILKKDDQGGAIGTVVPLHDVLAAGTLRGILRQAKVEPEDFVKTLRGRIS